MKRIRQVFSSEVKDKIKNSGDVGFVIDNNDFVIMTVDNIHVYIKDYPHLEERLKEIKTDYAIALRALFEDIAENEIIYSESSLVEALNWFEFYDTEGDNE